jgi:GAF domain-containing protein
MLDGRVKEQIATHDGQRQLDLPRDAPSIDKRHDLTLRLLEILNQTGGPEGDDVQRILAELGRSLDFDSVAIRLRGDVGFVLYESNQSHGLFIGPDRNPCEPAVQGGACLCGHLLRGQVDASVPCFTKRGSFWSNDYARSVATTAKLETLLTRRTCVRDGYASMASIPLRNSNTTLGLLHLADHRPGRFTPDALAFLESLGTVIGISLVRQRAARELKEAKERAEAANRAKANSWPI